MYLILKETFHTRDKLFFVLGLVVILASCATVEPAPFTDFANSLTPLRSGMDAQVGAVVTASRKELIEKVAAGKISTADLQLAFDPSDPFVTTYGFAQNGEPNFAKFKRLNMGLSALNEAMITYAQSLAILAGGGEGGDILPSTAEFDQMARDLNTNTGTAVASLKLTIDAGKQALLSTTAIELFKAYIENKRRKELVEAIGEVQPRVEEFSRLAQHAVHLLAELVETTYDKKILLLATSTPPNGEAILDFNDKTQATLVILQSMRSSYGALPAAHRDLMAAANKKQTGLAGIMALGEETSRFKGLVEQLAKENVATATASNQ